MGVEDWVIDMTNIQSLIDAAFEERLYRENDKNKNK